MKILHVWDQAGVACILAKHQRRQGHFVSVIKRQGYDPFGIYSFYGETELAVFDFRKAALKQAKDYDLIHIHSVARLVPQLKKKYPDKKVIMHYHGSELRNGAAIEPADLILLSTPDLKRHCPGGTYLPNPVDTEHFSNGKELKGGAFTIRTHLTGEHELPMKADIIDRQKQPTKYCDMPAFLKQYSTFIDMRNINGSLLENLSKTALEALACGLSVVNYKGETLKGLPHEHQPENVLKQLWNTLESA